jgi:predicted ATPase
MEANRLLHTLRLTNFLSYGPEGVEIDLQPLNVLIGANGSGKSNLFEALSILHAAPTNLEAVVGAAGGLAELSWKGAGAEEGQGPTVECEVPLPFGVGISSPDPIRGRPPLTYRMNLAPVTPFAGWTTREVIGDKAVGGKAPRNYFSATTGLGAQILVRQHQDRAGRREMQELASGDEYNPAQSILSQRKDPRQYPELTYLGRALADIYFSRSPNFGHNSPLRGPQRADLPRGFLLEDGSNLGMVLNQLMSSPATKRVLLDRLKQFCPDVEDVVTSVVAGTVETMFHERGLSGPIPSTRLSDGTLRYLCLLTILCHPEPPPLVCIEDPELGLHPDILCRVGELLIEASQKTQLIVTTHSDTLVSAFSEIPEAVVVCQKDATGTRLRRLEPERLKEWLEKYSLGELWSMGETGGNP